MWLNTSAVTTCNKIYSVSFLYQCVYLYSFERSNTIQTWLFWIMFYIIFESICILRTNKVSCVVFKVWIFWINLYHYGEGYGLKLFHIFFCFIDKVFSFFVIISYNINPIDVYIFLPFFVFIYISIWKSWWTKF